MRSAAASVAGSRPLSPTLRLALADTLQRDSSPTVRIATAEAIAHANADWPEARTLLINAAATDRDNQVRKAANAALKALDGRT